MTVPEALEKVVKDLRSVEDGFTREELADMLVALDAATLIVLRGLAEFAVEEMNA